MGSVGELLVGFLGIAATLIAWALRWAARTWGPLLTQWIERKIESERWERVAVRVQHATTDAVLSVSSELAQDLKRASSDGKISKAEAAALKRRAITLTREQLGPRGIQELVEALLTPDEAAIDSLRNRAIEDHLAPRVESAVKQLRMREDYIAAQSRSASASGGGRPLGGAVPETATAYRDPDETMDLREDYRRL